MSRRPPSPQQLMSPPDSPGQRRRFLRESDDAEGNISTTDMALPPGPFLITQFSPEKDPTTPFRDEICSAMRNFGLTPFSRVGKASKEGYEDFNLLQVRMKTVRPLL
ncbi:hypothetical protein N7495_010036 [Penicillium taxi]|uniref:uncharacterized protein n=1 Tax=Penicillium taxi TaxID=168475 RepID=UPI00254532A6|nr:uncharacterized protein N7495_010036 [Penicillium taxi]KAJ5885526.1 hypothetical protein N7495_010036 [Penicillium taxi]